MYCRLSGPSLHEAHATNIWIAVGGALGSAARHLVNVSTGRVLGLDFAWGTLIVNIVCSSAIGAVIAVMALEWSASREARTFLTTGTLFGFTTFSACSPDFATLVERRAVDLAFYYALGSVVVSVFAIFAGLWLFRSLLQ